MIESCFYVLAACKAVAICNLLVQLPLLAGLVVKFSSKLQSARELASMYTVSI